MGMSSGGGSDLKADMNVTPLVDVCLVLLIIFMVVTPMLKEGVAVQLPETKHGKELQEDKNENTVIAIKDDGTVHVLNILVPGADMHTPDGDRILLTRLREAYDDQPTKPLLIKADGRLKYGQVKRVMDIIKDGTKKADGSKDLPGLPVKSVKLATDRAAGAKGDG